MTAPSLLSQLGRICAACEKLNLPTGRSCEACGETLGDRETPSPAPPGLKSALRPSQPTPVIQMQVVQRPPPRARPAPPPAAAPPTLPASAPAAAARAPVARTATAAPPGSSRFILGVLAGTAPGQRFRLMAAGCGVGRHRGAILFADDPFLSGQHASFRVKDNSLYVQDENSVSGVYVSISRPEPLAVGGQFCIGMRVFRYGGPLAVRKQEAGKPVSYGAPTPQGSTQYLLEELLVGGRVGRACLTPGPLFTLGQANCDLCLPGEGGIAQRHCEVSPSAQGAMLKDLSGGLGTFIRIGPAERQLLPGDRVRMGQQTLVVELST